MFTSKFFNQGKDVKCFFRGYGSFGEICGEVGRGEQTVFQQTENYKIECKYEQDEYGVFTRNDVFTNTSSEPLTVHSLKSRFIFEGGEYQVYTQFNTWQNESMGMWQTLNTSISASGASFRTCQDAAPFMVLWSEQAQRGVAFHLIPNSSWEMKVTRAGHYCKYTKIVVEMGIMDYNFDATLAPGESVKMPQIICYEVRNKMDLDCYKLHNYMHTRYPRRQMPVIYDTWMYKFDHITYENVSSQIALAADLGVEYFFIDAGWFGKGEDWSISVGDWAENTTGGLCGRMIDIANEVRAAGMKFGLWLEPERANPASDSVKNYREYYLDGDVEPGECFLDYGNEEARNWMLGVVFDLIDKYGIEYIKDDFNANMYFDPRHEAYLKYHEGHAKFVQAIRDRYPNIYLTSCGAGGERMELRDYMKFDSAWPSDNESPYNQLEIYKNSILRLPPQGFERWVSVHSLGGFESFYQPFCHTQNGGATERMVACGDAVWKHIVGIQPSFLDGFMTGGPIGISCDLSAISPKARQHIKEFIAKQKKDRDFWMKAVARIICDTKSLTVLEYSDMELSKIVVQAFTHQTQQDHFCVYPVVCPEKKYSVNGDVVMTGQEIIDEGVSFETPEWFDNWHEMIQVTLDEVK